MYYIGVLIVLIQILHSGILKKGHNWDYSKKFASYNITADWQVKSTLDKFRDGSSNFYKVDYGPVTHDLYFMVEGEIFKISHVIIGRTKDQFKSLEWTTTSNMKFDITNFELDINETSVYYVLTLGRYFKTQHLLRQNTSTGNLETPISLNLMSKGEVVQFSRHKIYMTFLFQCKNRFHIGLYDLTNTSSSFNGSYPQNLLPNLEGVGFKDFVVLSQYRNSTINKAIVGITRLNENLSPNMTVSIVSETGPKNSEMAAYSYPISTLIALKLADNNLFVSLIGIDGKPIG